MPEARTLLALALVTALLLPAAPVYPQLAVFDGANLAQNLKTALRTLEAVLQRLEILSNQVEQLEWMLDNIQPLEDPTFGGVLEALIDAEQRMRRLEAALQYFRDDLTRRFEALYPDEETSTDVTAEHAERTATTLATLEATLAATRTVMRRLKASQVTLGEMRDQALDAEGFLEAEHAQGLLLAHIAEELSRITQQTALLTNLQAVGRAHAVAGSAQAGATFRELTRDAHRATPAYDTFRPLAVVPPELPRLEIP